MKIRTLIGPVRPTEEAPGRGDAYLLEFAPFTKYSVSETDARRLRRRFDADIPVFGHFDGVPIKQLLYLFSEGIIDGAVIAAQPEKEVYRLCETVAKPIYITVRSVTERDLAAAERLPVSGLYLPPTIEGAMLKRRKKPCILPLDTEGDSLSEEEKQRLRALAEADTDLILKAENPAAAEEAKKLLQNSMTEMRFAK